MSRIMDISLFFRNSKVRGDNVDYERSNYSNQIFQFEKGLLTLFWALSKIILYSKDDSTETSKHLIDLIKKRMNYRNHVEEI